MGVDTAIVMPTDEFAKHLGQFSNFAADLRLYLSFELRVQH